MTEYTSFYEKNLYPLQNGILMAIENLSLPFYLTGGTALSRVYLKHRYSDDLDLFLNADPRFNEYTVKALDSISKLEGISIQRKGVIISTDYVDISVLDDIGTLLKIDFVNDIPTHFGEFSNSSFYPRIDSLENILTNKISAIIGRTEIKDVVDIWAICKESSFDWRTILNKAYQKEACIDVDFICGILENATSQSLSTIRWIEDINIESIKSDLTVICSDIIKEDRNSLCSEHPIFNIA